MGRRTEEPLKRMKPGSSKKTQRREECMKRSKKILLSRFFLPPHHHLSQPSSVARSLSKPESISHLLRFVSCFSNARKLWKQQQKRTSKTTKWEEFKETLKILESLFYSFQHIAPRLTLAANDVAGLAYARRELNEWWWYIQLEPHCVVCKVKFHSIKIHLSRAVFSFFHRLFPSHMHDRC